MNEQEILELAAILVSEHGHAAVRFAESRRAQHAHEPAGESYRLWTRIAEAAGRILEKMAVPEPAESRRSR